MIELVHHGLLLLQSLHLADSHDSDSDNPLWILVAGPAGAIAVYTAIFRYYRNTDKTNQFERETRVEAKPVTGTDQKVDEVHGTRNRRIDGDNSEHFRQRVNRG